MLFGDGGKHAPAADAGARAGGEGAAKRLDALAHGAEPHALGDAATARLGPARAIVGNDELVKRWMARCMWKNTSLLLPKNVW